MPIITTGTNPKLMAVGINAIFGIAYDEYLPQWKPLFDKSISTRKYEEDVSMTGFGLAVQKTEGGGMYFDSTRQAYVTRYDNRVFALAFAITREEIADNQYAIVGVARTRASAFSMHQSKEIEAANIFNFAFSSTTGHLGGDGVSLCNASHPIEGGTFNNVPINALGAIQGMDLSEAALEHAIIDIGSFKDNRNNTIKLLPRKLVVPHTLQFEARRILNNPERPSTADRDINAMYQMGAIPEGYFVNHFFVDPDAWFITTNCPVGLRYFEREPLRFEQDNDFTTKNLQFSVTERYCFGWSDPRGIYGSPGA